MNVRTRIDRLERMSLADAPGVPDDLAAAAAAIPPGLSQESCRAELRLIDAELRRRGRSLNGVSQAVAEILADEGMDVPDADLLFALGHTLDAGHDGWQPPWVQRFGYAAMAAVFGVWWAAMRDWRAFTAGCVTGSPEMAERCREFDAHQHEWDRRYADTARLVWPDDPPPWPNHELGIRADILKRELLPGP